MRRQSGRASRARCIPGPAALPFLWGPKEVSAQLATQRTKRRNVCAGCRSSAKKQSRMQPSAASTSSPSREGSADPAGTAQDRSGLEISRFAAAAQEPMSASSPPLPRPTPRCHTPELVPPGLNHGPLARAVCALPGISVTPRTRETDQATRVRAVGLLPSVSSAVGAAALPSAVTHAAVASGSVVGGHVAVRLPRSIHRHVAVPSLTIGVSPSVSGWSTEKMLAELLGRYDSFDCASLSWFESLLTAHLRATLPRDIAFASKNGVNRRYVLATAVGTGPVRSRRMPRRLRTAATVIQGVTTADLSAHQSPLLKMLEAARVGRGIAAVPVGGSLRLSPQERAQFSVRHNLSAAFVSQLRQASGGNARGWASREVFRSAMSALSHEPGRQVWSDDRGGRLVSLRATLESLFEELSMHRFPSHGRRRSTCPLSRAPFSTSTRARSIQHHFI